MIIINSIIGCLRLIKTQTKILPENIKIKQISHIWNQKTGKLKSERKWETLLNMELPWSKIWCHVYDSFSSCKAVQFQWKFLHNVIYTEHKLSLMNLSDGKCCICKSHRETLFHLFWECDFSKNVWTYVIQKLKSAKILENDFSISQSTALFGSFEHAINDKLINTVIFETKWAIWKYRNNCKHNYSYQPIPIFLRNLFNDIKYQFEYKCRNKDDSVTEFLKYL
jgi:hypothetical protein